MSKLSFVIKATGPTLDLFGKLYKVPRRWLGLEPDFLYRKRIMKVVLRDINGLDRYKYKPRTNQKL